LNCAVFAIPQPLKFFRQRPMTAADAAA